MAGIDRRKHDIDVMERVLGSLHDPFDEAPIDVGHQWTGRWLSDSALEAAQVTAVPDHDKDDPGQPRPPRGDDEYESDRRGEHVYPDDGTPSPPSHRQRDDLKARLERRG